MPKEIEAKFRVADHEPIRSRLQELNAAYLGCVREINHILDCADSSLRQQGCGLRVRVAEPLTSESLPPKRTGSHPPPSPLDKGGGKHDAPEPQASARAPVERRITLTYKGPRQPGPFKSREEIETEATDADTLLELLERLGYQPVLSYQKKRESWTLDECRIELDEPPHIGLFVEIEGPNEASIRTVQQRLRLSDADLVRESYVRLIDEYQRRARRS